MRMVKLENGDIHYINNINDVKELVDPDLFEAIEELIENVIDEYDEENTIYEDFDELTETNEKLKEDLQEAYNEINRLSTQINKIKGSIYEFEGINSSYKKSNSKRVDKNILTNKLDEVIKELNHNVRSDF